MQIAPASPTAAPKRKSSKAEAAPTASAALMDTFTQESQQDQERQLRMEHKAQLAAQDKLHKERIAAMFAQLHTQLFSIWNEVWLQRQKVFDESFKSWLKLLVG